MNTECMAGLMVKMPAFNAKVYFWCTAKLARTF